MKDRAKRAHVIFSTKSVSSAGARCLHCMAELIVDLPCRLDDWLDAMRTFERKHEDCPSTELPDFVPPLGSIEPAGS